MRTQHPKSRASNKKTELIFENAQDFLRIGRIYAEGRRIPPDPSMAYKMFSLAISKGCRTAAIARQHISAEMDRVELSHARAEARSLIEAMSAEPVRVGRQACQRGTAG